MRRDFVARHGAAAVAANDWKSGTGKREDFYAAYRELLELILGADNYQTALDAYDGDVEGLCKALDHWIAVKVVPAFEEASKRARKRALKKARR